MHGVSVLPGVTYLDIVLRLLRTAGADRDDAVIENVVFAEAITTSAYADRELRCTVRAAGPDQYSLSIDSRWLRHDQPSGEWIENFTGRLAYRADPEPPPLDIEALKRGDARHSDLEELYQRARREQIAHGPAMRCTGEIWRGPADDPYLLASLRLETSQPEVDQRFLLHPALLDASTLAGFAQTEVSGDHPFIPMFLRSFRAPRALVGPAYVFCHRPERLAESGDVITSDYRLTDEQGRFLVGFTELTCKRIRHPELITRIMPDAGAQSRPAESPTPRAAAGTSTSTGSGALLDAIRRLVADALQRPPSEVPVDTGFYDLGMDSLAVLALGRRLEDLVGEPLYPTLLFEYSTIGRLAEYLAGSYTIAVPIPDEAGSPDPGWQVPGCLAVKSPVVRAEVIESPGLAVGPDLRRPALGSADGGHSGPLPGADAGRPPDASGAPGTAMTGDTPESVLSLRTEVWTAEEGPARPPSVLAVVGGAGGWVTSWPADLPVRMLPAAEAARHEDILVVHDADAAPVAACAALTRLAAAAVGQADNRPARITVACPGEPGAVLPAALAAVCRTITAETPRLTCRVATGPASSPAWLARAVADSSAESQLHFGGPSGYLRLVRRWRPLPAATPASPFRTRGTYLISGGSGGLGRLLAEHLATGYQARVLLLSRSKPTAALTALIGSWNAAGADVRHAVCDVSSRADVDAAVARARAEFGRIDGVVHCAGEHRDGIYLTRTEEDFAATFAAKVDGVAHLDAATADDDLDLFAVYSSLSANVANPGQCAYAAANAAAEALVRVRATDRQRPGRSVAIGWPYWREGGMRAVAGTGHPMPSPTGLAALPGIIGAGVPVVVGVHGPARTAAVLPLASAPDVPREDVADPVVIVGVAGRYPQAEDLSEFWDNLIAGRDCITEVAADRWDHDAIYDPAKGVPGRTYGKWGGFIAGVDQFDAPLFGISRREAERMDPQERIFLMTSWHALEDAGYSPRGLAGRRAGVFAGVMWNHYQLVEGDADGVAPTAMHASIANRVSFTFDFRGPSIALDTACSSSLTAIHLAVQALRSGECEIALAGGVNVTVHPQKYLQLAQGHWLSTDGRCRPFGAGGSGYVPGEGCGVVVLKRLSAALADGDSIRAVIGATAIDHGGRTSGATVPNPASQAALLRHALDQAGWAPSSISYVEAHGTGTSLGDPIEVDGLSRAFAVGGARPGFSCALGSVKSNIGHLEGAAGVVGLTKVLLQLRHRAIAPSLHSGELNPAIDFASTPFYVPQEPAPWTVPEGTLRRAGISAFGAGGANAHLLVAEYPQPRPAGSAAGPQVFPLSARDDGRLREMCRRLSRYLRRPATASAAADAAVAEAEFAAGIARLLGIPRAAVDAGKTLGELGLRPDDLPQLDPVIGCQPCSLDDTIATVAGRAAGAPDDGPDPADVAYTLQEGRASFERRLVVIAGDLRQLAAELERYAATGEPSARCLTGPGRAPGAPDGSPDDMMRAAADVLIGPEAVSVVSAWLAGDAVDWAPARAAVRAPMRVSLPGYPFEPRRYWVGAWRDTQASQAAPASRQRREGGPAAVGAVGRARQAEPAVPRSAPADGGPLALNILDDGIALITLRQPMFTPELIAAAERALARVRGDDTIRCVVVTGDDAVFSMGGTPEALQQLATGNGRFTDVPVVYEGLLRCDRPVVVAMQGHAAGGGLAFGLYGDVVLMSSTGEYRANFIDFGFTPGMGATHILERKLGTALATEMMLTSRAFTGAELAKRGANVIVADAAEVLPAALRIARSIARKPKAAVRALKAELAGRTLAVLPEVISREQALHEEVLGQGAADLVAARLGSGQPKPPRPQGVPGHEGGAPEQQAFQGQVSRSDAYRKPAQAGAPQQEPPQPEMIELAPTHEMPVQLTPVQAAPAQAAPAGAARAGYAPGRQIALDEVRAAVVRVLGSVLYLNEGEIDPASTFAEMGLDSVGAVELVSRLNREWGVDLDSVAVYSHPTIDQLCELVAAERRDTAALAEAARRSSASDAVTASHLDTRNYVGTSDAGAASDADSTVHAGGPGSPGEAAPDPGLALGLQGLEGEGPAGLDNYPPSPPLSPARPAHTGAPAPGPAPEAGLVVLRPLGPAPSAHARPSASPSATLGGATPPGDGGTSSADEAAPGDHREAPDDADGVAIIGMAARFPGAADPEAFWRNLAAGHCAVAEVPATRWDLRERFKPGRGVGTTDSKWAALLDRVDTFDERFFRLSPLDAQAMDPQQRLFLEEAWHALEDAGHAGGLAGPPRPWGVFVGCGAGDYADLLAQAGQGLSSQAFLGGAPSILPARIAYLLNLTGPTMAVDTACSSSLVAVHLAAASIQRSECELALAGGVAVMSTEKMQVWTSQAGMLSPRGQCRPFDASADGIVLGEGVGVVVLKKLSRALADGDTIHGIVRGSGVSGDGRSNGITAPNAGAQAQLLRAVCDRCGVTPADVTYVETHGTGTRLGDPIEVEALNAVYGTGAGDRGECALGSVKGNIGHTTMAAGVASLIKVLLALRHRQLPPSGGYTGKPNPEIDLGASPLRVVTELRPWRPGPTGQRIAAVSSFGFSGTNCHLVVSEPPRPAPRPGPVGPELVAVSARTSEELRVVIARLASRLRREPPRLDDLAFTLAVGRPSLGQRAAFVVASPAELLAELDRWEPAPEPGPASEGQQPPENVADELMSRARASRLPGDLRQLADAYRTGANIDWAALFGGRAVRRIPLPAYPFAARSHWVTAPAGPDPAGAAPPQKEIVHTETIRAGSPLARGHRVAGRTVLPAAASITLFAALARRAAALARAVAEPAELEPAELEEVRWLRPVLLDEEAGTAVEVRMHAGGRLTLSAAGQVSATGRVRAPDGSAAPRTVDIEAVRAACSREVDVAGLYQDFASSGLDYGGDFRALSAVHVGDGVAIATLCRAALPEGMSTVGWPPSVLDGAIQAAAALTLGEGQQLLPFSADRVEIAGTADAAAHSVVRQRGSRRFDVEITNGSGTVCLAVRGLTLRAATADQTADRAPMVFSPLWTEAGLTVPVGAAARDAGTAARVAVVGDPGDPVAQALVARAARGGLLVQPGDLNPLIDSDVPLLGVLYWVGAAPGAPPAPGASRAAAPASEVLTLLRHLIRHADRNAPLRLVAVTRNAFATRTGERAVPEQAAVAGLLRAATAEYPAWDVRLVDADADAGIPADLLADEIAGAARAAGGPPFVAIRGGRRLTRLLVADPPAVPAGSPWREGGCYLLLGGTGGIGVQLARHLAETAHARIALVGRRARNPEIDAIVADLERRGGQADYWQADATHLAELRHAVESIVARFGPVTGAIQCALQLRDRSLATMTDADLSEVLAPKADASINLVQALGSQPLEKLVFFSSALAFTAAPGQGNYAAASHFEDAYAAALRACGLPATVINWGFWGTVGAVATAEQRRRFAELGIAPIEPAEGMRALDAVLAAGRVQSVIVKGTPAGLARLGVADVPAPVTAAVEGFALLEELARALASAALRPLIDDTLHGASATAGELAGLLGVDPRHRALFDAVLAMLERDGVLYPADGRLAPVSPDGAADRAERLERELLTRHPALRPHAELTRRCAQALPDVLCGRVPGLDVIFPGGTPAQVEAVYAGNPAADYYHQLLARRLAGHVQEIAERERRQARVLEVGAGTGASTRFVVTACTDQPVPPELLITDVSRAFVARAEEEIAGRYPWVSCAVFDVERVPAEQGLIPGTYDAVYATNVIHATTDVVRALANAAALLRPGGLLLVNEITQPSDFATLTFGLTPGWWRFRDAHRRLPGGPLLSVADWEDAFRSAGLEAAGRLCLPSPDSGLAARQCVLTARVPDTAAGHGRPALFGTVPLGDALQGADPGAGADPGLPGRALGYVRGVFAEVLRFDESELDADATFDVFGVDSLVTLNIIDRLQEDLGPLPSTLLFEHLTLRALADFLVTTRRAELQSVTSAVPGPAAPAPGAAVPATAPPAAEPLAAGPRATPPTAAAATPIAVVGVAGRYPGSPDLDSFWRNLRAGRSCVGEVPGERWDWREYFDERRAAPDRTYCRWGGFLDGVDLFDPGFFGILPRDAVAMDPQERLFLETAWSLLQDAGYLGRRRESRTGVFVGTMYGSYGQVAAAGGWPGGHFGDGHSPYWAIANRVSYTFDFRGPSLAVDSACSSSAAAVHLACESLRRGECAMAIAGGVNLILHPAHLIALSQMGMLSASGQCRVFDEAADGFVPGEGVGAVLLKPLPAAEADGDDIWAVIRGSLANAGGKTSGFTVPNPGAQAELIAEAVHRSGLAGGDIGYVEAHGTGTALGDPIEVSALGRALRELGGTRGCVVGSVKSMIGHLEGASGIAGLTKAILQLRHQTLVPQPGFRQLNPKIDLSSAALHVPTAATPWEASGPRRAGVSSFGAGGANVHLVVEEYPRALVSGVAGEEATTTPYPVLLSARDHGHLLRMAADLEQWIDAGRVESVSALAFTSQVGRAEFSFRLAVLGADLDAITRALRSFRAGQPGDWMAGESRPGDDGLVGDADGRAFLDTLLAKRVVGKLARLWVDGGDIDWRRIWDQPRPRVTMPPYPWERRRFWLPDRGQPSGRPGAPDSRSGAPDGQADTPRSQVVPLPPSLSGQHRVNGQCWAPAAVLLDAVQRAYGLPADLELRDVRIQAPLARDDGKVIIDLEAGEETTGFALRDTHNGRAISVGQVAREAARQRTMLDLAAIRARCPRRVTSGDVYAALRDGGLEHGPALRALGEVLVGDGEVLAEIIPASDADPALLPARALDGAFQALAMLPGPGPAVPYGLDRIQGLARAGSSCWATAREVPAPDGRRGFDITLTDESGLVLTTVTSLQTTLVPAAPVPAPAASPPAAPAPSPAAAPPALPRPPAPPAPDGAVVRLLRPAWAPRPLAPGGEPPRCVLVLADAVTGQRVADELRATGASAILALRGAEFRVLDDRARYELRYDRDNLRRLIGELRAGGATPDAAVQWIGPAVPDGEGGEEDIVGRVQRELDAGVLPLVWTAGALLDCPGHGPFRVVVGYHGTAFGRPAMAGLGGALRSLALESASLHGTVVEIAPPGAADAAQIARELCAELTTRGRGDARVEEVRLDSARHVRTIEPLGQATPGGQAPGDQVPGRDQGAVAAVPAGVWLVTGGAGRIGRHLAAHLARRPGTRVILAGRTPLDAAERGELSTLAGPGSAVHYEQADVSDGDQARALVARVRAAHGPITAVVHAAGVRHDALVTAKTEEQVYAVFAPKVLGIEQLDAALADEPLELVVLFSSLAAWTGNLGQCDYAFANAYLDAFAARREALRRAGRRRGRSVSIGWPLWADGGMTMDEATVALHARVFRSAPLATAAALAAFDHVVASGAGVVFVSSELPDDTPRQDTAAVPASRPADVAAMVEEELRAIAAEFLLVEPRHVDMTADLLDTGFDSISLTKLVNELNERHDLTLLPTVLFERVSLADFASYLAAEHPDAFLPAEPPRPASRPDPPEPQLSADHQPAPQLPAATAGTSTADEVAIVGMAALLPGCHDLAEFWTHLAGGTCLTGPPPVDRRDILRNPATVGVRGGFLTGSVRRFDAALFGISPREAAMMDPQQRLFIETVWRAIEDVGYPPSALAGTRTGLYVGVSACDYDDLLREHGVPVEAHTASGVASCILANRVSHHFDLRGPSEAIDTACSSSLVALHHAVRAIQADECDQAIVGGVNLMLSPGLFEAFTKSGMLSPDGRCKAFDAAADGYGRGEGVGVLVLRRAGQARAAADHVYAVVRGSATNHGGHANSLTAPNPRAQAEVIAAAYRRAGLDPATVSYIEAHGTGTALGDPVEIEGLRRAFAEFGVTSGEIAVGTVKTVVGHMEAAAGVAGVIKVLLCAEHGELTPNANFTTPNPYLRIDETPFRISTGLRQWTGVPDGHGGTLRRAAISSFGFGGTNAHVVLDAVTPSPVPPASMAGPFALPLSAPTAQALREYAGLVADSLAGAETASGDSARDDSAKQLASAAYTLQVARAELEFRACVMADDAATAARLLRKVADGEPGERIWTGRAARPARPAAGGGAGHSAAPQASAGDLAARCAGWVTGVSAEWARDWQGPASRSRVPSFPFADTEFWFDDAAPAAQEVTMPDQRPPGSTLSSGSVLSTQGNDTVTAKITLAPPGRASARRRAEVQGDGTTDARPAESPPAPSGQAAQAPAAAPPLGAALSRVALSKAAPPEAGSSAAPATSSSAPAIRAMVTAVLGCGENDIDDDAPFGDLGLDSIFRMELVRHLTARYDMPLQAEQLYEHDSVSALAGFIDAATGGLDPASAQNPAPVQQQTVPHSPQPEPPQPNSPHQDRGIRKTLRTLIEEIIEREFDATQSFAGNGVTSFEMLRLVSSLEGQFGPLPKTLLFDYPTLGELAAELTERYGTAPPSPQAPASAASPDRASAPMPTCHPKRALADEPEIEAVVARMHSAYGREDGLAGRDIAPWILLGHEREGYFHVAMGRGALLAWNYTGPEDYFAPLAAQLMTYARAHGLRPNFLSLRRLETVGGEPVTATPFGAVQRIEDLSSFDLTGSAMSRLRYMVRRFERGASVHIEEYRAGSDEETDARLAAMVDRWTQNKAMINPYVGIVREEIRTGTLTSRHRVFLTYRDSELVNAIVVTRMAADSGYLLDVEFYPPDAPLGGLETAIVKIIEKLRAEGDKVFSFGASFGVRITSSANAAPEIERGLEELRSVGIFGEGNFKFKNKFRPVNIPIYLCQPASEPRTSLADVILLIASPDLVASGGQPQEDGSPLRGLPSGAETEEAVADGGAVPGNGATSAGERAGAFRGLLAAHGYNPLAISHDDVPVDLGTDSWAELDRPWVRARVADLDERVAHGLTAPFPPPWLPFRHVTLTGSGKTATAIACRSLRRRGDVPRNTVAHNAVFPTWMPALVQCGFDPADVSRPGSPGEWDDALVEARLADPGTVAICVELSPNAGGGAPVSAKRLAGLRRQAAARGVPVILDATRVVDNVLADGRAGDPWPAVSEVLTLGDLVMMSLTKNFGVPAGGLLATSNDALARLIDAEAPARGPELPLTARKLAQAALADTDWVADMVGRRAQAVRALHAPLHAAGLPVLDAPGGHCVLLDTARLAACEGFEHPQLACLSWVFEHTGVRGAPHLATSAPLAAAVRFAVPVGMTPDEAARAGTAIADSLTRPHGPRDLIAVQDGSDLAATAFHPRVAVPDDVAEALHEQRAAADQNAAVLAEDCPDVRRSLLRPRGTTVEVFTAGQGPVLVLLPPFNIGAGIFARQFAGLADRTRLIAVHLPGLGSSGGVTDLSLDGLSDLVADVLDELGVTEPVHMCGASFGGLPALTFVLRHPQRSRSLALLGSSFKIGNRVGELNRLEVVARADFDAVAAGSGAARVTAGRAEWERTLLRCESMDPRTGLRYLDVFAARPSLLDRLPEIAVPTLIVHGRHDTVIPLKTAHLLHGLIPGAQYVEVPDAGHFPGLTEPDVVNAAISELLNRAGGGPAEDRAAAVARPAVPAGQS